MAESSPADQSEGGTPRTDAVLTRFEKCVPADFARQLERELAVSDRLIEERNRVLRAIPGCEAHGDQCVPHALEWIEAKLQSGSTVSAEQQRHSIIEECATALGVRVDSLVIMCDRAGYTRQGNDLAQRVSATREAIDLIRALKKAAPQVPEAARPGSVPCAPTTPAGAAPSATERSRG